MYISSRDKSKIISDFFEKIYLEHIRAFNNFYEENPLKKKPQDFLDAANNLIISLKANSFDYKNSIIPVNKDFELYDGAHRLSFCSYLKKKVYLTKVEHKDKFDYTFFQKMGLNKNVEELGVLEYVKYNDNAYIVNIFPVINEIYDSQIVKILERYGFVYYKKTISITHNGMINLKKINYRNEDWIGNYSNDFVGLKYHARNSSGNALLRVFVFVCEDLEKVIKAKQEIRVLCNLGNFPIHINDTRDEAIELAQTYFNENSLYVLNYKKYYSNSQKIDCFIDEFKKYLNANQLNSDDFCASGSTPLGIFGVREINDFDFISIDAELPIAKNIDLSNHESELSYYPVDKESIIINPRYHFYYHGIKFITLDVLLKIKTSRNEKPKDIYDIRCISFFKLKTNTLRIINNIIKYVKKYRNKYD
jgi:hypothetical protein